jgi:hypothetical protein
MTVIISSRLKNLIVMSADSAVTTYYSDGSREYDEKSKMFVVPGVGCVTTWGEQIHNKIGRYFRDQELNSDRCSFDDLIDLTYRYLTEEYRPKDDGLDDVGYHIGGFDQDGQPRLFHLFWGFDRPRPPDQDKASYHRYDHSNWKFLYNGRNDLADDLVKKLIDQMKEGVDVRYDPFAPEGLVKFNDFVVRFAAELTQEVGPPFYTTLIFPDNEIKLLRNEGFSPISLSAEIREELEEIGTEYTVLDLESSSSEHTPPAPPSGIPLPEEYNEGGTVNYFRPNLVRVCSCCGKEYEASYQPPGVLSLCPDCLKGQL